MNVAHTTNFMSTAVTSVIKLMIACLLITQINAHAGFVLGRGVITSENGDTLWAEYNADGGYRILEDIKDNDAHTVAGLTLLAYQNQLQAYETRNPNAQYLTKAAFDAINITAQNGKIFNKPSIPEEAKVVVLPESDKILTEHHEFIEYIWLPYDIKEMGGIPSKVGQGNVPEVSSYLIGKNGKILYRVKAEGSSIGPLNGYYYPVDINGELVLEQKEYQDRVLPFSSTSSDQLINPVPGVMISGFVNKKTISASDGWINPSGLTECPNTNLGLSLTAQAASNAIRGIIAIAPPITLAARLPFAGFSVTEPKQRAYYAYGLISMCDYTSSNIFVSMQSVMGGAQIFNPDAGIVPLTAKTSFHLDTQRNEATYLSNIDFDGDDIKDPASYLKYEEFNKNYIPVDPDEAIEATHMGIYFSTGVETDPETNLAIPSIIRAVDRVPQHKNKGLLKTINIVDLAQTDLFVFRVSNGQLITSHKGVEQATPEDDYTQSGAFNNAFNFQFAMRGPDDYWHAFNPYPDYAGWASATKVTEPFQKRNADHIRPGEQLQLVAINRASGYIGSVKFTSKQVGVGGDINNALDTIIMRPPNLKIWAERVHEIKQGKQVAGENEKNNLIGNEGITLEDDLAVSIHTEWFDHNGLPLPAELGDFGYTARIAKVTSVPTPDVDALQQNSSNEFAIKPGRNLNVLQFNQKELSRHHFYVQVNPYPKNRQNDFGEDTDIIYHPKHQHYIPSERYGVITDKTDPGYVELVDEHDLPDIQVEDEQGDIVDNPHELRYRPAHYVPFKVPLYDEGYSQIQKDVYEDLKEQHKDNPSELEKLEKPDPLYRWYYRPELQFSQYNFDAKSLIVNQIDDEGTESTTEIDIEEDGTDFGPIFDDYTDSVELLFDLLGPNFDRLPALENDREFVLSLGGEEAIATIGANGKVTFENPEHLTQLTEEDLLSLRLYLNGDAGNLLWEYKIEHLFIDSRIAGYDLETNDTWYVTADDPIVPLQAILLGFADRDDKERQIVDWTVEGQGSMSPSLTVDMDTGVFTSDLVMPNTVGAKGTVTAKLRNESGAKSVFKEVVVVPGEPALMTFTQVGGNQLGVMGTLTQTYETIVRDQYGNLVADGTSVDLQIEGYANLESQSDGTIDGKAQFVISGSERQDDSIQLKVRSGNASAELTTNSPALDINIQIANEFNVGQSYSADITVTNPSGGTVAGLPISLSAPYLNIFGQDEVLTDAQGRASIQIKAPDVALDTYLHARVGYAGAQRQNINITYPQGQTPKLTAENYQPLLGEKTQAGSLSYERYDNQSLDINYQTYKTLGLNGEANQSEELVLGDAYFPNHAPKLALALNYETLARAGLGNNGLPLNSSSAVANKLKDDSGQVDLAVGGIFSLADNMHGLGSSLMFDENVQLTSTGIDTLKNNQPNWAFSFKPQSAGTIIQLGNAQRIGYNADNSVYFEVDTASGTQRVTKAGISLNQWHKVGARIHNGELQLFVDDFNNPQTTTLTQGNAAQIAYSGNILKIGGDFHGQIQDLRYYDQSSAPLLRIVQAQDQGANDDPTNPIRQQSITLDNGGIGQARIASTGQLNANGETIELTYVNATFNGSATHIPIISEEGFKRITGAAANIGLIGPAIAQLDPNNIDYLAHSDPWATSPFSSLSIIPSAHAWGWVDTLDLFIPISSINDVIDQIGKIGTEEFNPVILIISGLDIALLFSGPLKPALSVAFKPLKKLAANPAILKVMKILGPFFGNVIKKVGDSKSIDPILNLLPFFMILGEIAADEEARQAIPIIVDAISSSEDLEAWFEYFRLPSEGWTGDEIPSLELDLAANDRVHELPLSGLMNQAYAADKKLALRRAGKEAGEVLVKVLKDIKSGNMTSEDAAKAITGAMSQLVKAAKDNGGIRAIITDRKTLIASAALVGKGGHQYVRDLLRGKDDKGNAKTSRTPIFLMLASVAYLESRFSDACTQYCIKDEDIEKATRTLYGLAFGRALVDGFAKSQEAGYQFHLTTAALLHLTGELGVSPYGKLIAIEQKQQIPLWKYSEDFVETFTLKDRALERNIDLVTQIEGEDRPQFIELKSYKGREGQSQNGTLSEIKDSLLKSRFSSWAMKTTTKKAATDEEDEVKYPAGGNHRQYLLDRIASTNNGLIEDEEIQETTWKAQKIHWLFQDYKQKGVGGYTQRQIGLVIGQLAKNAKSQPVKGVIEASLGVPKSKKYDLKASKTKAAKNVKLFNVISILKDENTGQQVLDVLFDMADLDTEQRERLAENIKNLILEEVPSGI